jgi:DNA-directed RNA polymerase specialized sigma24 family protein
MTRRRSPVGAADPLKDEVYRQMLRLEAGRPAAQLALAVALLQAWTALDQQPADSEPRQWLRTICPVCLRLIQAACRANDACCHSAG